MIIIAGTIDLDPARREECLVASVPLQEATRRDEPGCLTYVWAADPVVSGRIHVTEIWEDAETLDAHLDHENYWAMRKTLRSFGVTGTDVYKYRIDAQDRVYGEDGKASATFWSVE